MGWGLIDLDRLARTSRVVSHGLLKPEGSPGAERLGSLYELALGLLEHYSPRVLAIESAFVGQYPKAALALAEARGVIISCAHVCEIEVRQYAPAEIKRAITGHGNAPKERVRAAVVQRLAIDKSTPLDASDALAIALTHAPQERAP